MFKYFHTTRLDTSHTFLATPTLDADILTTNRHSLGHACSLMPGEYECVAIWLVLQHSMSEKFSRRTLGRSRVYRLLTLPEGKGGLNTIIVNNIY